MSGHVFGGWAVSAAYILSSGQPYTASQFAINYFSGPAATPITDEAFNLAYTGTFDGPMRPFLGNPAAPVTQVGIYAADACNVYGVGCTLAASQLISLNSINQNGSAVPTTKGNVRFIANGFEAEQIFGTPYGNVGPNTLRGAITNNWNMSVIKNIKFWERVNVRLHLDAQDVFNHLQAGALSSATGGGIDPFIDDAGFHSLETGFGDPTVQFSPARVVRIGVLLTF